MNRLPPPLITAIGLLAIYGLSFLIPAAKIDGMDGGLAASIFFTLAAGLLVWSGHSFRKHQTTVNPFRPERSSTLVTSGPYRFTRNPMYLAMILFLWSSFTFVANWTGLIVIVVILIYFDMVQVKAEETALEQTFGDDFRAYAAKVRKWI